MLLEYGASQWLARTLDNPRQQQSIRPIDPNGTIQKEVMIVVKYE